MRNSLYLILFCLTAFVWGCSDNDEPKVPIETSLTYTVTVPEGTIDCYIKGEQTGGQFIKMTSLGENKFQIEIKGATEESKYNYYLEADLEAIEKDEFGKAIVDRTYAENDDVINWKAESLVGLRYTVDVPEGTMVCYIAGAQTGWKQVGMKAVKGESTKFTLFIEGANDTHGYKYCAGPTWEFVEKGEAGNEIGNRGYSTNDVVARWASIYLPGIEKGDITITVTVPDGSPEDLYIAGSFQGNKPTTATKMTKLGNNKYSVVIKDVKQISYKILCGRSWENEEVAADGEAISDRTANTGKPEVSITVEKWKSTVVAELDYNYIDNPLSLSPHLTGTRNIWIYLPSDYKTNTTKKYPVLYMHDGQNVFENGGYGSWEVHKAMKQLESEGFETGIIVAINNGAGRLSEYSPFPNPKYSETAQGDEYLQSIIKVVMPYVNENYRTLTGPENTGIAGSSMGGLISYYGGLKHPEVFGKVGAISPSFWYCKTDLLDYVNKFSGNIASTKIYFIAGDSESTSMVTDMQEFYDLTKTKGLKDSNTMYEVVEGGKHSESSWALQIGRVYKFLFTK